MTRRHVGLYFFFGLPIAGALAGSYLHLAAWLRPWMPPGWERLSWVAALALDGLILAPIMARQIVGADVTGAPLRLAQGVGISASVYVNARWGTATMGPVTRWDMADVAVGAAILPLLALIGEHAMRATLAALQAQESGQDKVDDGLAPLNSEPRDIPNRHAKARMARQAAAVASTTTGPTAPVVPATMALVRAIQVPPSAMTGATKRATRHDWRELVARYGDNPRAIADATGTPLRTVQRWRQQAAT